MATIINASVKDQLVVPYSYYEEDPSLNPDVLHERMVALLGWAVRVNDMLTRAPLLNVDNPSNESVNALLEQLGFAVAAGKPNLTDSREDQLVAKEFKILLARFDECCTTVGWYKSVPIERSRALARLRLLHDQAIRELVRKLAKFEVAWKEELAISTGCIELANTKVAKAVKIRSDVMFFPRKTNIATTSLDAYGFLSRFRSYDNAKYLLAQNQELLVVNTAYRDKTGEPTFIRTLNAAGYALLTKPVNKSCFRGCLVYWLFDKALAGAFVENIGAEFWEFQTPE